jgi:hypothetical protein
MVDLRSGAPVLAPVRIESNTRVDWRRFSVGLMVEWWHDNGLAGSNEVVVRTLHDDGETSVTALCFLFVPLETP